jgi:predicted alpha/beta-fold hydrolase
MRTKFNLDFEALNKIKTWKQYDENVTQKFFSHYPTIADFYFAASSLHNVK